MRSILHCICDLSEGFPFTLSVVYLDPSVVLVCAEVTVLWCGEFNALAWPCVKMRASQYY